jgi:hypothetical protein
MFGVVPTGAHRAARRWRRNPRQPAVAAARQLRDAGRIGVASTVLLVTAGCW